MPFVCVRMTHPDAFLNITKRGEGKQYDPRNPKIITFLRSNDRVD